MFAPEGERHRDRTGQTPHSLAALPDNGLHRSVGKLMQRRPSAYPPRLSIIADIPSRQPCANCGLMHCNKQ
jgi:hypothetical protein